VFGLSHLLGFRFAQRIKDLKDRRLYVFDHGTRHSVLETLVGGRIDTRIIVEQWPALLRLAASIKSGTVAPSVMLRKLSAAGRHNALGHALRQLGRIERTGFVLDWLSDPALRLRSHAGSTRARR
jgi:TnpA family transposase